MSNKLQIPSIQSPIMPPLELTEPLDPNPLVYTANSSANARSILALLNQTETGILSLEVNGSEISATLKANGSAVRRFSRHVTTATLQRAVCAFLSEVFHCSY